MPSDSQSRFQPPPPIRTSTVDSTKSHSSGTMSPASETLSPTSTYARGALPVASPAEHKFFDVISRVRDSRSRSRSRARKSRERSRSPMALPPNQARPQQPRHVSTTSQTSVSSARSPTSPTGQGPARRTSSDMWRGRHSNTWLFNDFSFTDTAKNLLRKS